MASSSAAEGAAAAATITTAIAMESIGTGNGKEQGLVSSHCDVGEHESIKSTGANIQDVSLKSVSENLAQQPISQTEATMGDHGEFNSPSPLSGAYLLIVLAEPHSELHKEVLLKRLAKGLLSWDSEANQVDIDRELHEIASQCPQGEDVRNGEKLIQLASDSLVTEILIHPQLNTFKQCLRNLLASFTRHRHIVHAGYTLSGAGSWILQDGIFDFGDFLEILQDSEVQRLLRAYGQGTITMDIHCSSQGDWASESLSDQPAVKSMKIAVNPPDRMDSSSHGLTEFVRYISDVLPAITLDKLLEPSDVVGNIRFSHPTLYVFPGGQGDSALFGISGFNILVDGGFGRKPCFWDFTRHLDRLDAVVMTRTNSSSLSGLAGAIYRKASSPVYPHIGHIFANIPPCEHPFSPDGDKDGDPLLIHLMDVSHSLSSSLSALQLKPQSIYRDNNLEPINLYHKVGHGTLDMYIITPSKDSREVKEFLQLWKAGEGSQLGGAKRTVKMAGREFQIPLVDLVSVCALLVWQPADPSESITRILFPGSAPQSKILEGFEKLRHLDILKTPTCTGKTLAEIPLPTLTAPTKAKSKLNTASLSSTEKLVEKKPLTPRNVADIVEVKHVKALSATPKLKQEAKEKPVKATEVRKVEKTKSNSKDQLEKEIKNEDTVKETVKLEKTTKKNKSSDVSDTKEDKPSTPRPKSEIKSKVDSNLTSSRTDLGEAKKKAEAKVDSKPKAKTDVKKDVTVNGTHPTKSTPLPKLKKEVANLKEVEAKVNTFKTTSALKKAEDKKKTDKPEGEKESGHKEIVTEKPKRKVRSKSREKKSTVKVTEEEEKKKKKETKEIKEIVKDSKKIKDIADKPKINKEDSKKPKLDKPEGKTKETAHELKAKPSKPKTEKLKTTPEVKDKSEVKEKPKPKAETKPTKTIKKEAPTKDIKPVPAKPKETKAAADKKQKTEQTKAPSGSTQPVSIKAVKRPPKPIEAVTEQAATVTVPDSTITTTQVLPVECTSVHETQPVQEIFTAADAPQAASSPTSKRHFDDQPLEATQPESLNESQEAEDLALSKVEDDIIPATEEHVDKDEEEPCIITEELKITVADTLDDSVDKETVDDQESLEEEEEEESVPGTEATEKEEDNEEESVDDLKIHETDHETSTEELKEHETSTEDKVAEVEAVEDDNEEANEEDAEEFKIHADNKEAEETEQTEETEEAEETENEEELVIEGADFHQEKEIYSEDQPLEKEVVEEKHKMVQDDKGFAEQEKETECEDQVNENDLIRCDENDASVCSQEDHRQAELESSQAIQFTVETKDIIEGISDIAHESQKTPTDTRETKHAVGITFEKDQFLSETKKDIDYYTDISGKDMTVSTNEVLDDSDIASHSEVFSGKVEISSEFVVGKTSAMEEIDQSQNEVVDWSQKELSVKVESVAKKESLELKDKVDTVDEKDLDETEIVENIHVEKTLTVQSDGNKTKEQMLQAEELQLQSEVGHQERTNTDEASLNFNIGLKSSIMSTLEKAATGLKDIMHETFGKKQDSEITAELNYQPTTPLEEQTPGESTEKVGDNQNTNRVTTLTEVKSLEKLAADSDVTSEDSSLQDVHSLDLPTKSDVDHYIYEEDHGPVQEIHTSSAISMECAVPISENIDAQTIDYKDDHDVNTFNAQYLTKEETEFHAVETSLSQPVQREENAPKSLDLDFRSTLEEIKGDNEDDLPKVSFEIPAKDIPVHEEFSTFSIQSTVEVSDDSIISMKTTDDIHADLVATHKDVSSLEYTQHADTAIEVSIDSSIQESCVKISIDTLSTDVATDDKDVSSLDYTPHAEVAVSLSRDTSDHESSVKTFAENIHTDVVTVGKGISLEYTPNATISVDDSRDTSAYDSSVKTLAEDIHTDLPTVSNDTSLESTLHGEIAVDVSRDTLVCESSVKTFTENIQTDAGVTVGKDNTPLEHTRNTEIAVELSRDSSIHESFVKTFPENTHTDIVNVGKEISSLENTPHVEIAVDVSKDGSDIKSSMKSFGEDTNTSFIAAGEAASSLGYTTHVEMAVDVTKDDSACESSLEYSTETKTKDGNLTHDKEITLYQDKLPKEQSTDEIVEVQEEFKAEIVVKPPVFESTISYYPTETPDVASKYSDDKPNASVLSSTVEVVADKGSSKSGTISPATSYEEEGEEVEEKFYQEIKTKAAESAKLLPTTIEVDVKDVSLTSSESDVHEETAHYELATSSRGSDENLKEIEAAVEMTGRKLLEDIVSHDDKELSSKSSPESISPVILTESSSILCSDSHGPKQEVFVSISTTISEQESGHRRNDEKSLSHFEAQETEMSEYSPVLSTEDTTKTCKLSETEVNTLQNIVADEKMGEAYFEQDYHQQMHQHETKLQHESNILEETTSSSTRAYQFESSLTSRDGHSQDDKHGDTVTDIRIEAKVTEKEVEQVSDNKITSNPFTEHKIEHEHESEVTLESKGNALLQKEEIQISTLKPENVEYVTVSGGSSTTATPLSPLSPHVPGKTDPSDKIGNTDESVLSKDGKESHLNKLSQTETSMSVTSQNTEDQSSSTLSNTKEVDPDVFKPAVVTSSIVVESESLQMSSLSTITSSEGDVDNEDSYPESIDSRLSSQTYDKLVAAYAESSPEVRMDPPPFSSGPSSWASNEMETRKTDVYVLSDFYDGRSATSSISPNATEMVTYDTTAEVDKPSSFSADLSVKDLSGGLNETVKQTVMEIHSKTLLSGELQESTTITKIEPIEITHHEVFRVRETSIPDETIKIRGTDLDHHNIHESTSPFGADRSHEEDNKDSLHSSHTGSSDYERYGHHGIESKVDDSSSSVRSECSDRDRLTEQLPLTPRSDISASSYSKEEFTLTETISKSTATVTKAASDSTVSESVIETKTRGANEETIPIPGIEDRLYREVEIVETDDPKLAAHDVWFREEPRLSQSTNPFSEDYEHVDSRYEEADRDREWERQQYYRDPTSADARVEPKESTHKLAEDDHWKQEAWQEHSDRSSDIYYQHHDVDSDRQSDAQSLVQAEYTDEYYSQQYGHFEDPKYPEGNEREPYEIYEPDREDQTYGYQYSAKYSEEYETYNKDATEYTTYPHHSEDSGDHRNGNVYQYYQDNTAYATYDDPNSNNQAGTRDGVIYTENTYEESTLTQENPIRDEHSQQQSQVLSQVRDDPLASWGKPLGLPAPVSPMVVNGVDNKKSSAVTSSPQRRTPGKPGDKLANGNSNLPPFYVDLAYIPHHGNPKYCDVEFFKRIRARHYVLSSLEPSVQVLEALLEGKQSWTGDDKELDVTIIPTYDSDALGLWVSANEETLARNRIDLAPSASRCTINLQDHETSCSAYRLEF